MNVTESGRRKRDAGTPSTGLGLCSPSLPNKSEAMRTLLKAQHELLRAGGRSGQAANIGKSSVAMSCGWIGQWT
jgi:hypothetical protein